MPSADFRARGAHAGLYLQRKEVGGRRDGREGTESPTGDQEELSTRTTGGGEGGEAGRWVPWYAGSALDGPGAPLLAEAQPTGSLSAPNLCKVRLWSA